ncbi:MAG: pyridoxamine 5'-phosphate oxidase family protein, partial [Gammaproteobacteria bacterium]|nr:pyridoxamine 5'-phosphate oxidase family protein [Gammaproteobacteria bacterium]
MEDEVLHAVGRLVRDTRWAALATLGPSGPLASQVAWSPDPDLTGGQLHLSRLAAHTRHLLADPRAALSLTEPDDGREDPQTLPRIALEGEAEPLARDEPGWPEARARYLARFPAAGQWFDFTDFTLFRFRFARARYVGGFA